MTISLANALTKLGYDVTIITSRRKIEPLVKPSQDVRIVEFPTFRYYETKTIIPFYISHLIRNHYDFLITFFADFGEGATLRFTAPFSRYHHILYLTFPYESAPHRYEAYQRWGWETSAELILADAAYTAKIGSKVFGRQVYNLPSGTDPQRFRPNLRYRREIRSRFGFLDEELVLLNVSALEKRKGTWRVIEVMPKLLERDNNVSFLILGDGPEKYRLQKRASELGVADRIIFVGSTSDLPPYYNAADVFVMLSDSEAGSIALLEAMSSGLPVIVSDNGGFREVVSEKEGFTIGLIDPKELIEAVEKFVGSSDMRRRMGLSSRMRIEQDFSWIRLAENLGQFLLSI